MYVTKEEVDKAEAEAEAAWYAAEAEAEAAWYAAEAALAKYTKLKEEYEL